MKKILFIIAMLVITLMSYSQDTTLEGGDSYNNALCLNSTNAMDDDTEVNDYETKIILWTEEEDITFYIYGMYVPDSGDVHCDYLRYLGKVEYGQSYIKTVGDDTVFYLRVLEDSTDKCSTRDIRRIFLVDTSEAERSEINRYEL